jgi:propanol-preferring alcohol dehydrogenase
LSNNPNPLELVDWPIPEPPPHHLRIQVTACAVCHTELDEIEGRLPTAFLPIILGHQIVGRVHALGPNVSDFQLNDRVGVPWIYSACGTCQFCQAGLENLCPHFQATGKDHHGGYADFISAPAAFTHKLPDSLADLHAAPLLCAGAIGYRSLKLTNLKNGQRLALTGFGASAHLVLQLAKHLFPSSPIDVFARSQSDREFARALGADWAGDTNDLPPAPSAAIIDTTPAWQPVLAALRNLAPAGRLVINAIRKETTDQHLLTSLDYPSQLWLEKEIKSAANVTRHDVHNCLQLAAQIPIQPKIRELPLENANQALRELKSGAVNGALVLRVSNPTPDSQPETHPHPTDPKPNPSPTPPKPSSKPNKPHQSTPSQPPAKTP